MALTVYSTNLAGSGNGPGVSYINAAIPVYPPVTHSNIFGPVYTPRVYASNLDTLELASSGRLSLTVADVHVIDMTYNNAVTALDVINRGAFHIDAGSIQLAASNLNLVGALSVSRLGTQSWVSSVVPTDTLVVSASNIVLGASNLQLVGALSVTHSGNISTISTVPGDSLHLSAELIHASGRVEVAGAMSVAGGFDAVSSASGIITVGTLPNTNLGGLSIGDPQTSSNSFLWHWESDVSHWELIGGDLRVTRVHSESPTSRVVSYTIRIADDDALEIHKSTSNSSGPSSHRRVARFGGS